MGVRLSLAKSESNMKKESKKENEKENKGKDVKKDVKTVKKVKLLKTKGSNNLQPMFNEDMLNWLANDPDPDKTLNEIKKEQTKMRSLSKHNPIKLMKQEMTEQEYLDFWKDIADLRAYYAIEYKKKDIKQEDFPQTYHLPQCVYNANAKYWKKVITEKRFLEHPEFMIVNPDDIVKKGK